MKRKIFTFVSTLALSAALIVSAQAASAPCSARSRSFCYPDSVCLPCAPSGCITLPCPSAPETPDEPETVRIDPDCAEKLEHARGRILNLIKEKRPRFVPAFELMTFRDNTISVSVPTTELREEILRSKTGMLMRIAELAGIEGMIELEVTVNEEIRAARPIKLEDRVRYITEKNPLVAELRKALDLEVE